MVGEIAEVGRALQPSRFLGMVSLWNKHHLNLHQNKKVCWLRCHAKPGSPRLCFFLPLPKPWRSSRSKSVRNMYRFRMARPLYNLEGKNLSVRLRLNSLPTCLRRSLTGFLRMERPNTTIIFTARQNVLHETLLCRCFLLDCSLESPRSMAPACPGLR